MGKSRKKVENQSKKKAVSQSKNSTERALESMPAKLKMSNGKYAY